MPVPSAVLLVLRTTEIEATQAARKGLLVGKFGPGVLRQSISASGRVTADLPFCRLTEMRREIAESGRSGFDQLFELNEGREGLRLLVASRPVAPTRRAH